MQPKPRHDPQAAEEPHPVRVRYPSTEPGSRGPEPGAWPAPSLTKWLNMSLTPTPGCLGGRSQEQDHQQPHYQQSPTVGTMGSLPSLSYQQKHWMIVVNITVRVSHTVPKRSPLQPTKQHDNSSRLLNSRYLKVIAIPMINQASNVEKYGILLFLYDCKVDKLTRREFPKFFQ
jgi:hypothetical protein